MWGRGPALYKHNYDYHLSASTSTGTSETESANEGTSSRKHEKTTVDHEVKHATNRNVIRKN